MIRLLYVFFFVLGFSSVSIGQYQKVEIGIDGFTCSMCGMSVENSIKMLPFVAAVEMDLNKNTAQVFFRPNREVSILKLADQVYSSGFSIRYIQAEFLFSPMTMEDYQILKVNNEEVHFLGIGKREVQGMATLIFLNKKLISKKNYARWEEWIKNDIKRNGKKDNILYGTLK